ncbi:hypothetical protein KPSA1_04504 [Pseudomonas syringae pv. actinidiae]|uniref:Uncharacterized protein n=1 Tax=Pseudomonas syringae pv. actinidiae TaxID=103796 RepID=A0A2V0QD32_PSESF|nr:hypothetical protein KPSA1_04504 [Pseudomonas syringae pv. actinidiae]
MRRAWCSGYSSESSIISVPSGSVMQAMSVLLVKVINNEYYVLLGFGSVSGVPKGAKPDTQLITRL